MPDPWWRRDATGLRLSVRVLARAGADAVAGLFGVPKASVRLLQGGRSRDKLLAVDGARQLPELLRRVEEGHT